MSNRLSLALALGLFASCASPPDESKIGNLDFYDWFRIRRAEYASALDLGSEGMQQQVGLKHILQVQINKRYDAIVERAASEEDPDRRELAVSALGFSQRPESVAHLEPRLVDPIPTIRGSAAAAIGFLRPPNPPIDKILPLLSEPDAYVRQAALFAIKEVAKPGLSISKEGMDRILLLALEDALPEVRNEAVLALGRIQDPKTVEPLGMRCLRDPSALVRRHAAYSLGLFGPSARESVPYLIDRLKDGETEVVNLAHWALKMITGRIEEDRQYGNWADWLSELAKVLEFICPRHAEEKAKTPGACPKCGVPMEARVLPGAEFACPEHPEVVSLKSGQCFKCQKNLLPRVKDATPK